MTKEKKFQIFKGVTTWGGVAITVCGIIIGYGQNKNLLGASVSMVGVAITCLGHLVNAALSKHQKAEQERKLAGLREDIESANERFEDPDLKRIIAKSRLEYSIEHQDDFK